MGRPTKNVGHPVVRLRIELSKDSAHQVTRKDLAKRTGVPASSLKDIETGRYKMTPEVADQIAHAVTGLSARSLLAGDNPLLDLWGKRFTKDSPGWPEELWGQEDQEVRQQLFSAIWDVARKKKRSRSIAFIFEAWLLKTFQAYGMEELLIEELTDRLPFFDPALVSEEFRPKIERLAKKWERVSERIQEEYVRVERQDRLNNPEYYKRPEQTESWETLTKTESGRAFIRDFVLRTKSFRAEARKRVAQQMQEEATKTRTFKPLSGKRPRSARRPEA